MGYNITSLIIIFAIYLGGEKDGIGNLACSVGAFDPALHNSNP